MENSKQLQLITDQYLERILKWAIKKTGNRFDGEDLAMETMVQIFSYLSKSGKFEKIEHAIWKVAHYVWCNHLRALKKDQRTVSIEGMVIPDEETDFAVEIIENEIQKEDLLKLRREIANLSFLQRQALILHYFDGLPIAKVAERLSTSEGAIKWHLFDARQKVKKELSVVKEDTSHVYRPGKLSLGISGIPAPDPDTRRVNESLIKQNICLLCYSGGKTLDEIAQCTGIPKPYLEFELDWLIKREFIKQSRKRYFTDFAIIGKRHAAEVGRFFVESKNAYVDIITSTLMNQLPNIRKIGFYGADFLKERLMWTLLTLFTSYFSRESHTCAQLKKQDDRSIRPDGGRYYIIGNDLSDSQREAESGYRKPDGWNGSNGIYSDGCLPEKVRDSYFWLGLYNFKNNVPDVVNRNLLNKAERLHRLLCSLIRSDFGETSLNNEDKELLAEQLQNSFVAKSESRYLPQFCIIEPKTNELAQTFSKLLQQEMPEAERGYLDYFTYLDIWQTGVFSFIFAAQDGKLLIPKTPEEGVPLTLVLVN